MMKTPMIRGELPLVPTDLSTSTFMLPAMEDIRKKNYFAPRIDKIFAEQLKWTPPGWKSPNTMRLWPLKNGGKGRCIFHSVSAALWGCDDDGEMLERMAETVLEQDRDLLFPIYKKQFPKKTEEEARKFWDARIVKRTDKRGRCQFLYFILANILRRPIIAVTDEYRRKHDLTTIDTTKKCSKIFLPTLLEPGDCSKTPLVLGVTWAKNSGHSSALAGVSGQLTHMKLFNKEGKRFPIWYGKRRGWKKDVSDYLSIEKHAADGKTYWFCRMDQ
ncbi:unnamed protein product, partial [Ascophyllum nodosum]